MLYLLMSQLGWLTFTALLIVVVVLYTRINQRLGQLRHDMIKLQIELEQHKNNSPTVQNNHSIETNTLETEDSFSEFPSKPIPEPESDSSFQQPADSIPNVWPPKLIPSAVKETKVTAAISTQPISDPIKNLHLAEKSLETQSTTASIEPDERSLPMVTSIIHSIRNWFFGGNLVVRVGVLVLLVGVVLLLRLLSDYIEIPITIKLIAIGVIGLGLAGLGLTLVKKRFAYGITLQGAGLAIAYLTTFFAYSVYQVISSLPSFMALGILSAFTVALAVRQNAFPLALLALSGGFFAPILTSQDTGSLTVLFSYYLLLNVTIAVIAHYRPWKVLNLFGVMVTFGLAYYWGLTENLTVIIDSQRWTLVTLIALHVLLYLFVVIRYAQQIIAYNNSHELNINSENQATDIKAAIHSQKTNTTNHQYLFPIDIGLLFSVPVLAFGLFSALLHDINHALTIVSAILAAIYLGLGWIFIQRNQRYTLITEGMLALGFGFLALVIPLALDAEWIAFGWSVQGLALVWLGRRSLRAWSVLFGLLLQLISIVMLLNNFFISIEHHSTLALTISAISALASVFILRASNSPALEIQNLETASDKTENSFNANHTLSEYTKALGINEKAAQQWLASINSQSLAFKLIWQRPALLRLLTLAAMGWLLYVLVIDFDQWFASWRLATTALIGLAALTSLIFYYIVNQYSPWLETRQFSHGLLLLFYAMLLFQLPQKYEFDYQWTTFNWPIFTILLLGWLVLGQLWLKIWHDNTNINRDNHGNDELKGYDSASWLGSGIIILAEGVHYGLPDSKGVITILVPVALMLAGLWLMYRQQTNNQTKNSPLPLSLYWFGWQEAILNSAKVFVPLTLCWVIFTNFTYDGVIWGLPYFPLFNLYDVTLWLIVFYGLGVYLLGQSQGKQSQNILNAIPKNNTLLIILALIAFWICSSMLVRTLYAFIGTPLWISNFYGYTENAWDSEQVQTGLTILWTLLALAATIIASRYFQRALWFMGIGLLGVVVLKLVLVDLSQTEAVWRVISFLGAGSLILVIGYLAPLPPAREGLNDEAK